MTDKEKVCEDSRKQDDGSSRRRRIPSAWILVPLVVLILLPVVVRFANLSDDHAVVNVLTGFSLLLALIVLLTWFLLFSGYRRRTRLLTLAALILTGVVGSILFKIDNVSGDLVPAFVFRWTPPADELLQVPQPSKFQRNVDLATTTENDFPQFLGPHRDLRVDGIVLDRDWQRNPPKCLWRRPIGAGWSSFVAVNGFAVTLEQRGEQEMVTCYEVQSGRPVWVHSVRTRHATTAGGIGPRSTPTIDEGKVYTLGATGVLLCLDGASGEVVWSDDILKRYGVPPDEDEQGVAWGRSASPLVVDDLLIVPVGGPGGGPYVSLAAFNKNSGELVWEAGDRQVSYSSPALATLGDGQQVLSVNEDNVSAHDPRTGQLLWSYDWPGGSTSMPNVSQPVPLGADRVLLSKGYGGGSLLLRVRPAANGRFEVDEIWREKRSLKTKFTNVVVREGCIYGLSEGILECVDAETGTRQWKRGRYGHGQLLGVGPLLLVQAENGDVAMVEATPRQFKELGRFAALEDKTWNNMCLYGRLLLVRNSKEAACFELPVEEVKGVAGGYRSTR